MPDNRSRPKPRQHVPHAKFVVLLLAVVGAIAVWAALRPGPADSPDLKSATTAPGGATGAPAASGLQVDQPSVDLGTIPLDTPVSHTFALSNVGAARATLGKVTIEALEGC